MTQAKARRPASGNLLAEIGRFIPLPLPVPDWSKPIIALLLALAGGFGLRAWRAGRRSRQLADDLMSTQSALVPEIAPRLGQLTVSVAYRPADGPAAGGDFYDAFMLRQQRVAILLGDVSGHGRAALVHATRMRYMLRAYLEAGLGPGASLKLAGQVLGATQDGLFTTVAVAIYDVKAASLTYATAGHPPPLIGGAVPHEALQGCASPALGWGAPTGRRETTIPFAKGSWACLFSDGLTEARGARGLLGRDGLAQLLTDHRGAPSAQAVLDEVRRHAKEIRDDMAACIIAPAIGGLRFKATTEVLEVAPPTLEADLSRFLAGCRMAGADMPPVIERARAIALEHGAALVRAEVDGSSTAPGSVSLAIPARVESAMAGALNATETEADRFLAAAPRRPSSLVPQA